MTPTPNKANQAMTYLLPCPFCGCTKVPKRQGNGIGDYWLECFDCGASTRLREDGAGSEKDWNRRPATSAQPSQAPAAEAVQREGDKIMEKLWNDPNGPFLRGQWTDNSALPASPVASKPIDMVLHCPKCGTQHIDAEEWARDPHDIEQGEMRTWTNPIHRSHLCHACQHIWRPADVPTNGVAAIQTHGKNDSPVASNEREAFEAWMRDCEGYPYARHYANLMWKAWRARARYSKTASDDQPDKPWWHALAVAADAVQKSADVWQGFGIQDAKVCIEAYLSAKDLK